MGNKQVRTERVRPSGCCGPSHGAEPGAHRSSSSARVRGSPLFLQQLWAAMVAPSPSPKKPEDLWYPHQLSFFWYLPGLLSGFRVLQAGCVLVTLPSRGKLHNGAARPQRTW